jgi:sulfoxide reductase catalytic subunit YedY
MRIRPSEITPESAPHSRRRFLAGAGALGAGLLLPPWARAGCGAIAGPGLLPGEQPSTWEQITTYNNFYEYSPDKHAVAELARNLNPHPWTVRVEGEVERPRTLDLDDLRRAFAAEDRIYRMRCVEGWSKVVPWQGFPLCALLAQARPTSRAKFVRFTSLHDPLRFYGQRRPTLPWPYTEALAIGEAMHPLTILATGLYGRPLPNQNGAPVRLVVPWKYGYKSIKSIVAIHLEERQPATTWSQVAPSDYSFHANVDPRIPLARGTHARETRIGELRKRDTLLYNGYADHVAPLYAGPGPS